MEKVYQDYISEKTKNILSIDLTQQLQENYQS
jgi:hypothetical protein